jgi:hypothetical protein
MKCFTKFKTSSYKPLIDNTLNFEFNRSYLLNRQTVTEHHIASRAKPNTRSVSSSALEEKIKMDYQLNCTLYA